MIGIQRLWRGLAPAPRDAVLYGSSLAWAKTLSMLMLPVLTALLTPTDFARIELLSSAAEIGALFAGAGLVDTTYRFASGGGAAGRRAAAEILGLGIAAASLGIALMLALAPHLAPLMPLPVTAAQLTMLGISVALESLIGVPLAWMRMHGRSGQYAVTMILRVTAQTGLVAGLVSTGWGVSGVLAAGAISAIAAASLLTLHQARETRIAVNPAHWGRFLGYGLPLVGGGLASFVLGSADRWLLAGSVPSAALGHYALAAKIAVAAALLTQPFELWWYPRRMALLNEPDGLARSARIVTSGVALTLLAAAAAAAAGPPLIRLLTPAAYHPACAFVPWLAAAYALQSLGSLVNAGCYARKTGTMAMAVNGIAAAVALGLYLLLIPGYGVAGAITATLAAQAVRFLLFLVLSQRLVRLPLRSRPLLVPLAGSLASVVAAQLSAPGLIGFVAPVTLLALATLSALVSGALPAPFRPRSARSFANA